ncbi:MAG: superoxide dismutase, Ni [Egibacteraceae bacterium]
MSLTARILALLDLARVPREVHAHCDIPCGVYDPEQARIEAESCLRIMEKYAANDDPLFRERCVTVKEERAELAKHHISVLWSDYFKPDHLVQFPNLHEICWNALKQCSNVKHSLDKTEAAKLLALIDQIDDMWKKTGGAETTRVAGRPG